MNKIALLAALLLSSSQSSSFVELVSSNETSSTPIIYKSVDEDLKSFNFDYERYKISKDQYYKPIMINFAESINSDYSDLVYFYLPNSNEIELMSLHAVVKTSDDFNYIDSSSDIVYNYELIEAGTSSDGLIYRYALDAYDPYRALKYRRYDFFGLKYKDKATGRVDVYELNNSYLYESSSDVVNYSNCVNVILEDAHGWSWHFDEDSAGENLWESFVNWAIDYKEEILRDQIFFSFYVKNWSISEIRSIDIEYKKCLMDGYRFNIADSISESQHYEGKDDHFKPKLYKWNDNNNASEQDRSVYIGSTAAEAGSQINYTKDTITSEIKNSIGAGHSYEWNTIMDIDEFKAAFGTNSSIYNFAKGFFKEEGAKYWIINYDQFFYNYTKSKLSNQYSSQYPDYFNYLLSNNAKVYEDNVYFPFVAGWKDTGYYHYKFTQEYIFDFTATTMTFEDANGVIFERPVSVAPTFKEATGGLNDDGDYNPKESTNLPIIILIIIAVATLIIGIFWKPIKKFFKNIKDFFVTLFVPKSKRKKRRKK